MRAFLVEGPGKGELVEVEEPRPGHGELLIAPAVVGLCGSDVELLMGRRPPAYVRYPTIPGHEWAGYVLESGPGVFGFAPGTAVVAEGIRSCGHCARCAEGRNNLCTGPYAETGFTHPGALAERLVVPAHLAHPLPADRPIAAAGLLEPAACVATGLLELGIPRAGSRLAVVGDGPLGLLACALLRTTSPRELVLFGARPARLAFGERMGATATMLTPPPEDPERDALRGGFDVVVECTDSPAGAAFAVELARRAGSVVLIVVMTSETEGVPETWNGPLPRLSSLCSMARRVASCSRCCGRPPRNGLPRSDTRTRTPTVPRLLSSSSSSRSGIGPGTG